MKSSEARNAGIARGFCWRSWCRFALVGLMTLWFPDPLMAGGAEARELFNVHCALCHGRDGRARVPIARVLGVKDLSLSQIPDTEIEKQIKQGRKGEDGKEEMPAFDTKLTAEQIKALVPVVKSFRK